MREHIVEHLSSNDPAHKLGSAPWIWFFTNKLLNPMKSLLVDVYDEMPKEPTKENTNQGNTQILIELRDWFLEHLTLGGPYPKIFRALWNLIITKYWCDSDYAFFLDIILEEWQKKPWKPRNKKRGISRYWKYPDGEM